MKSTCHDGFAVWSARGSNSADTFTTRATGVDGTCRAKWIRSMMNRRGPVIGRLFPFDSCIHAPPRHGTQGPDDDPSRPGWEGGAVGGRERTRYCRLWEGERE